MCAVSGVHPQLVAQLIEFEPYKMTSATAAMAMHVLLAHSMLVGGTVVYNSETEWIAGHEVTGSSTSSALALSFPLHRLEPYCTCVWLDPLVIASGPDLPPMRALPMTHDDDAAEIAVEAPSSIGSVKGPHAGSGTAAYILSSEPMEMDRQNVADRKDGARAFSSMRCRESKNADHLLSVDSFSFMRNDCSADKWVAIKLSQSIKLTAVDISMLELYSSRVKTFDLYVSATKPVKTDTAPWQADMWTHIATMKLENKKGQQAFYLQAQQFSKFLLLHFTSHFGTEPVCTINTFRAFGITEAEDLEEQLTALQGSTHDMGVQESPNSSDDADAAPDSTPPDAADKIDSGNKQASSYSQHKRGKREDVSADQQRRVKPANAETVPSNAASRGAAGHSGQDDVNENRHRRDDGDAADMPQVSDRSPSASHTSEPGHAAHPDSGRQGRAEASARSRDGLAPHNQSDHAAAARPGKSVPTKSKPAPQVLPHVFNEAVAVAVNGAGGIANAPVPGAITQPPPRQGHGAAAEDVGQGQHVSDQGPKVTQATSSTKLMADRQRKQSSTAGPRRSDQSPPQRCHWKPSAAYVTDKQRKGDAARQWTAASGSRAEDRKADQRDRRRSDQGRHEEPSGAEAGSPGAGEAAGGAATADARKNAGRAHEKPPKASAAEPLHDTAAPSKGGAASVYDLIKKELVALKVETSTLGKLMKQAAPQTALQQAVRRHAETEAKLSMVAGSLLALEARLDGLVTVQQEESAAHLAYLQVAYGILALAMVVCLATVLFSIWVMCRQVRLHRDVAGYITSSMASHEIGGATACAPPEYRYRAQGNSAPGIRERVEFSQLGVQGRTASHFTPKKRHCAARMCTASERTPQRMEGDPPTSAWSPARLQSRSDSHMQAGSVHVIRPVHSHDMQAEQVVRHT